MRNLDSITTILNDDLHIRWKLMQ